MSNFSSNKPAIAVTVVGLIVFVALCLLGSLFYIEQSGIEKEIKTATGVLSKAKSAVPAPNRNSVNEQERFIEQYRQTLTELEQTYAPFRKYCVLPNIKPDQLQQNIKDYRESLRTLCREKNILITDDSSWCGFLKYASQAPRPHATPELAFEFTAISSLLNRLTDCGLSKFIKVYRAPLPVEAGTPNSDEEADLTATPRRWQLMPFEIAFRGDRESIFKALNIITSDKRYLFTVAAVRIKNERPQPVPIVDEAAAQPGSAPAAQPAATADSLLTPEEAAENAATNPAIQEIVKPYMGNEQIDVQLSLNLVFFLPEKSAPAQ